MKELSIEQKAKAYDEAYKKVAVRFGSNVADEIFLKESEDERTRKWLIEMVEEVRKANSTNAEHNGMCSKAIAWLEKQCEKGTNGNEREIPNFEQKQDVSVRIIPSEYVNDMGGNGCYLKKQCEQNLANSAKTCKSEQEPAYKIEQKHAWSEEDENNILFLSSIIEECFKDKEKITLYGDNVCANFTKEDVIDRLKSLKERYTWKPSDEQMNTLEYYMLTLACNEHKEILVGLYTDLNKLREK